MCYFLKNHSSYFYEFLAEKYFRKQANGLLKNNCNLTEEIVNNPGHYVNSVTGLLQGKDKIYAQACQKLCSATLKEVQFYD